MSFLTNEIVSHFLEETLKISNWRSKLETDKFEFLKEFLRAYLMVMPYTNIPWSVVPKSERKLPTVAEVVSRGGAGLGGTCVHLNFFFKCVLVHLGYDAFVVGGETPLWKIPRSHMVTIVRFETTGTDHDGGTIMTTRLYLTDVGFGGRCFMEPIPLHDLPYVGRAGGFTYEYRFNEERGMFQRFLRDGCPMTGKFADDHPGMVDYYFDLKPLNWEDYSECLHELFSPQGTAECLDSLLMSRMTLLDSKDEFEYISVRNIVLVQGTKETRKQTIFPSYDAMIPTLIKLFPTLNQQEVPIAFAHYTQARIDKVAARTKARQAIDDLSISVSFPI